MSRITRIDYDTGEIVWNMGFDMPSGDADFGDNLFSFQHAPQILPNGNMMVYDNGNRRDHIEHTAETGMTRGIELAFSGGEPPTGASIVWEHTLPEYSPFVGDADRLPGGNTLMVSGPARKIYEVEPDGTEAWRLELIDGDVPLWFVYRAERIADIVIENRCPQDLAEPAGVDFSDLLVVLADWHTLGSYADFVPPVGVGFEDLLEVLANWGPCP